MSSLLLRLLASLISSLYTGWSGCYLLVFEFDPLAPLNPLSHGCAYILWWLLASSGLKLKAFASPGGKLPFRVPFLVPLLWYKGGSLSHLLKKSRRKIAPSLRFRGDCGRLPHSRRWITVEGGGVVRESCSAINRSAAPCFLGGCRCCLFQ